MVKYISKDFFFKLFSFFFLSLMIYFSFSDPKLDIPDVKSKEVPDFLFKNVRIVDFFLDSELSVLEPGKEGVELKKSMSVFSSEATIFEDDLVMRHMDGLFYLDGHEPIVVFSDEGRFSFATDSFELFSNKILYDFTGESVELYAEEMRFDDDLKIVVEGHVRLLGDGYDMFAHVMEIDFLTERLSVLDRAHIVLHGD